MSDSNKWVDVVKPTCKTNGQSCFHISLVNGRPNIFEFSTISREFPTAITNRVNSSVLQIYGYNEITDLM